MCGCNWRCEPNGSVADNRTFAASVEDAQFLSVVPIYLARTVLVVPLAPLNLNGDGTGFSRNDSGVLENKLEFSKSASVLASEGLIRGI